MLSQKAFQIAAGIFVTKVITPQIEKPIKDKVSSINNNPTSTYPNKSPVFIPSSPELSSYALNLSNPNLLTKLSSLSK